MTAKQLTETEIEIKADQTLTWTRTAIQRTSMNSEPLGFALMYAEEFATLTAKTIAHAINRYE